MVLISGNHHSWYLHSCHVPKKTWAHSQTRLTIIPAQTPNSMGRNTWAEKLQAFLLSNCTLRFLCRAPALSVSGPSALCVGAGHSLRRPWRRSLCQTRRSVCRGPALSVSGPGALCIKAWRFLSLCESDPAPRAPSSDPRATHPARRVPFFQERTPNLTVWGKTAPL